MLSNRGKNIYFPKLGILSQSNEAVGKKINATIGIAAEDDLSPMTLEALKREININPDKAFLYAPSFGKPDIRKIWKDLLLKKNPGLENKTISDPVVTCALTHGLSMAGYLFCNENDTIITSNLNWENYYLVFENSYGSFIKTYNLFTDDNKFDSASLIETLEKSDSNKKIVILNFPNNPSGYTPTIDEAKTITKILTAEAEKGTKIVAIIDDAYFGLVYEDQIFKESLFTTLANAHENILAIKVDGPTKEDYVWGFRIGFVTFGTKNGSPELYAALEQKLGGAIRGTISNASSLSQSLLVKAYNYEKYDAEKLEKYKTLQSRYIEVKRVLEDNPEYEKCFKALPFNSGYFMCIKLKPSLDSSKIRNILLEKYSTGVLDLGGIFRIAFSSVPKDMIKKLFDNIYSACQETENITT